MHTALTCAACRESPVVMALQSICWCWLGNCSTLTKHIMILVVAITGWGANLMNLQISINMYNYNVILYSLEYWGATPKLYSLAEQQAASQALCWYPWDFLAWLANKNEPNNLINQAFSASFFEDFWWLWVYPQRNRNKLRSLEVFSSFNMSDRSTMMEMPYLVISNIF